MNDSVQKITTIMNQYCLTTGHTLSSLVSNIPSSISNKYNDYPASVKAYAYLISTGAINDDMMLLQTLQSFNPVDCLNAFALEYETTLDVIVDKYKDSAPEVYSMYSPEIRAYIALAQSGYVELNEAYIEGLRLQAISSEESVKEQTSNPDNEIQALMQKAEQTIKDYMSRHNLNPDTVITTLIRMREMKALPPLVNAYVNLVASKKISDHGEAHLIYKWALLHKEATDNKSDAQKAIDILNDYIKKNNTSLNTLSSWYGNTSDSKLAKLDKEIIVFVNMVKEGMLQDTNNLVGRLGA